MATNIDAYGTGHFLVSGDDDNNWCPNDDASNVILVRDGRRQHDPTRTASCALTLLLGAWQYRFFLSLRTGSKGVTSEEVLYVVVTAWR